jgi:hypothetical protein
MVRPAPGEQLSAQPGITPSWIGVGLTNLAPPVTSGSALCVVVGEEGRRERGLAGE